MTKGLSGPMLEYSAKSRGPPGPGYILIRKVHQDLLRLRLNRDKVGVSQVYERRTKQSADSWWFTEIMDTLKPSILAADCGGSYFIVARMLFGTLATTLYFESTNSVMSYFNVDAKRIATSLSVSL